MRRVPSTSGGAEQITRAVGKLADEVVERPCGGGSSSVPPMRASAAPNDTSAMRAGA
jgi:hypothetical protein